MAKKPVEPRVKPGDSLDSVIAQIRKEFGDGAIMKMGENEIINEKKQGWVRWALTAVSRSALSAFINTSSRWALGSIEISMIRWVW